MKERPDKEAIARFKEYEKRIVRKSLGLKMLDMRKRKPDASTPSLDAEKLSRFSGE